MSGSGPGWSIEWGKIALLVIGLLGGFACVITGALAPGDSGPVLVTGGFSTIAGVIGYVTGNGRLASKGEASVPAIGAARQSVTRIESDAVTKPVAVIVAPSPPAAEPPPAAPFKPS